MVVLPFPRLIAAALAALALVPAAGKSVLQPDEAQAARKPAEAGKISDEDMKVMLMGIRRAEQAGHLPENSAARSVAHMKMSQEVLLEAEEAIIPVSRMPKAKMPTKKESLKDMIKRMKAEKATKRMPAAVPVKAMPSAIKKTLVDLEKVKKENKDKKGKNKAKVVGKPSKVEKLLIDKVATRFEMALDAAQKKAMAEAEAKSKQAKQELKKKKDKKKGKKDKKDKDKKDKKGSKKPQGRVLKFRS